MRYLIPLLLLVLSLAAAGCGRQNAAPGPEPGRSGMMDDRTDMRMNDMGMAEEAAELADEVEGVDDAWAVVIGPSQVMIGLMLEEGIDETEAERIEERVAEEVPRRLDGVEDVTVTSNPDMVERIREISRGVREGRPVSEFADEIDEMMNRLAPRNTRNEA